MLCQLKNLGSASEKMLQKAGIDTEAQLQKLGSVAAYHAVVKAGAKPSLNLLWALEGALTQRDWKEIAREERMSLLLALEELTVCRE